LPALARALGDQSKEVWKDALDGLVTLGGDQSLAILREERQSIVAKPSENEKLEWIDEAIDQVIQKTRS